MTDRELLTASVAALKLLLEHTRDTFVDLGNCAQPEEATDNGVMIVLHMLYPALGSMIDMIDGLQFTVPGYKSIVTPAWHELHARVETIRLTDLKPSNKTQS
jgi:hypothetical protein